MRHTFSIKPRNAIEIGSIVFQFEFYLPVVICFLQISVVLLVIQYGPDWNATKKGVYT